MVTGTTGTEEGQECPGEANNTNKIRRSENHEVESTRVLIRILSVPAGNLFFGKSRVSVSYKKKNSCSAEEDGNLFAWYQNFRFPHLLQQKQKVPLKLLRVDGAGVVSNASKHHGRPSILIPGMAQNTETNFTMGVRVT